MDERQDGQHAVGVIGAALHDLELSADAEAEVGVRITGGAEGEGERERAGLEGNAGEATGSVRGLNPGARVQPRSMAG